MPIVLDALYFLALLILSQHRASMIVPAGNIRDRSDAAPASSKRLAGALAAAAMPVVALLMFSAFIWWLTGSPLTWATWCRLHASHHIGEAARA